jgi:DNA replication and repair protein RecF
MRLDTLTIARFRNIGEAELLPGPGLNVLYGNNGEGKTNFLEAVFYIGTLRSFRTGRTDDLLCWGEESAILGAELSSCGTDHHCRILLDRHGRRVKADGKAVPTYADYCSLLAVILFTPEEIAMGRGAPEVRRRYLNRAILSGDVGYIPRYQEMARILRHRNALLRSGSTEELGIWTERFSATSAALVERRLAFIDELNPLLALHYSELAGGDRAEIRYVSSWSKGHEDYGPASAEGLLKALAGREREERLKQTTLIGPHRDEVSFLLNGRPLRHHASQGEQRSFVIALKMAEIELVRRKRGEPPVLLLDDLTSELDPTRNRNLFDYLKRMELQVFITTTSRNALANLGTEKVSCFRVHQGRIHHED